MTFTELFERFISTEQQRYVTPMLSQGVGAGEFHGLGPLYLRFSIHEERGELTLRGLDSDQVYSLLEDYFEVPNRSRRGGALTDIENIIQGQEIRVTLTSGDHNGFILWISFNEHKELIIKLSLNEHGNRINHYSENKGSDLLGRLSSYLEDNESTITFIDNSLVAISEVEERESKLASDDSEEGVGAKDDDQDVSDRRKSAAPTASATGGSLGRNSESDSSLSAATFGSASTTTQQRMQLFAGGGAFVQVMVGPNGEINFCMNAQRPRTEHGRKQASHFIAYLLYVRAVLASMDDQYIHEIPGLLMNLARHFLGEDQFGELQENVRPFEAAAQTHLARSDRKALTAELREKGVGESTVQNIKRLIKIANANLIANLICALSSEVLRLANASKHVSFIRTGKSDAVSLGKEGARMRNAMEGLRAFQEVVKIRMIADDAERAEAILGFKSSSLRYGLRNFVEGKKITEQEVDVFIRQISLCEIVDGDEKDGDEKEMKVPHTASAAAPSLGFFPAATSSVAAEVSGPVYSLQDVPEEILDKVSDLIYDFLDFDYYEYMASTFLGKLTEINNDGDMNEDIDRAIKSLYEQPAKKVIETFFQKFNRLSSEDETACSSGLLEDNSGVILITTNISAEQIYDKTEGEAKKLLFDKINNLMEFIQFGLPCLKSLNHDIDGSIKQRLIHRVFDEQSWREAGVMLEDVFSEDYNQPVSSSTALK